jgi:hypothetical protein
MGLEETMDEEREEKFGSGRKEGEPAWVKEEKEINDNDENDIRCKEYPELLT